MCNVKSSILTYFDIVEFLLDWSSSRNSISTFDLDSTFEIKIRSRLVESKFFTKFRLESWRVETWVEISVRISTFSTLMSKLSRITSHRNFQVLIFRSVYYILNLYCIRITFLHYLFALSLCIISLYYQL